jgi:ribosome-binding factor A
MEESKRQKQIGGLLQKELTGIFQRLSLSMIDGGMLSISSVKITPDLLEARIYLSLFQVKDEKAVMEKIDERSWEIKRDLASKIKLQLRRIPELKFFQDDTLDYVFKMEEVFRDIQKNRDTEDGQNEDPSFGNK